MEKELFIPSADMECEYVYQDTMENDSIVTWVNTYRPELTGRQAANDNTSTLHTYNNLLGGVKFESWTSWCNHIRKLWVKKDKSLSKLEKRVVQALIDYDKGISPDHLIEALEEARPRYYCRRVPFNYGNIKHGFAVFRILQDMSRHYIAIQHGWAMDSVTQRVWLWDGQYTDWNGDFGELQMIFEFKIDPLKEDNDSKPIYIDLTK